MMNYFEASKSLHEKYKGKITVQSKIPVENAEDLSLVYSPGVAGPSEAIAEDKEKVWNYTIKGNAVAIVSDGSAVLGLGNIGPEAAIPVMEGKAMLFKDFANIDAFPICLDTQDPEEIIKTITHIAPVFGGINLEDIAAPRCFDIEQRLQNLGIPVFHDDQHGTAIVVLAGLINASRCLNKPLEEMKIAINGSGGAGIAIAKMLRCISEAKDIACIPVADVIVADSKGIISRERDNLSMVKKSLLSFTNIDNRQGSIHDALEGVDAFIGVSVGDLLTAEDISRMNPDPIVFAIANPIPEIMPDEAKKGGAAIVGTGRSDFPNQINNVLGFPGIFRGALDARATTITPEMKLAAAYAIADAVAEPSPDKVIPSPFDRSVPAKVGAAVKAAWEKQSKTDFVV